MKKLLIPFVASFGLSLGVATGVVMMRTPKIVPMRVVTKSGAAPRTDHASLGTDVAAAAGTDSTSTVVVGNSSSAPAPGAVAANMAMTTADSNKGATAVPEAGHPITAQAPVTKQVAAPAPSGANASGANASGANASGANARIVSTPSASVKALPTAAKPAAKPAAKSAAKSASDSLIGRRLAQVFGAMQSKDAARVLQQMDDTDVRAILGSLSSKQQAAILGSFPTQRAAMILQATLRTASTGGAE